MSKHKQERRQGHDAHALRRAQFVPPVQRSSRLSWNVVIVGAGFVLLSTAILLVWSRTPGTGAVGSIAPAGADVRLDAAQFDEGVARFYRYTTAAGAEIRFFVLKSSDGVVRAAFDTCDVCYQKRKGYRQVGDTMVCNNCGQVFRSIDINVLQGGCNPVPLDRVVQDGQVVLTATALQAGTLYF